MALKQSNKLYFLFFYFLSLGLPVMGIAQLEM